VSTPPEMPNLIATDRALDRLELALRLAREGHFAALTAQSQQGAAPTSCPSCERSGAVSAASIELPASAL
jgi:hypothetical protein